MNTPYDFKNFEQEQLAYIRPVEIAELPKEVRDQAEGRDHVYAVHNASGDRLALVADKNMAFLLARQNDLAPVNVH